MEKKKMNKDECLPLLSFEELLNFVPEVIRPGKSLNTVVLA
jgi:hypothetical protein